MDVYNEAGEIITEYDLTRGYLHDETTTVHHDAIEGVKEIFHYETIREYPNGGKDVEKIVDLPGVEAKEAYDEKITRTIYTPYTQEQLNEMEQQYKEFEKQEKAKQTRLEDIEAALIELASLITKGDKND